MRLIQMASAPTNFGISKQRGPYQSRGVGWNSGEVRAYYGSIWYPGVDIAMRCPITPLTSRSMSSRAPRM